MSEEIKEKMLRKGEFNCATNAERVMLLFFVGLAFTVIILVLSFFDFGEINFLLDTMVGVCVFMDICLGIAWAVMGSDRRYEYEALETEFIITGSNGKKEFFYYSDIKDITYVPFRASRKRNGYIVTITTGIRDVVYRYVFSDNKFFTEPEGTPFFYLAYNAGLAESTPKNVVNPEAILNQFESRQRLQQRTKKGSKGLKTVEEFLDKYGDK